MDKQVSERLSVPIRLELKHIEKLWSLLPGENKSMVFIDDAIEYVFDSIDEALKNMNDMGLSCIRSANALRLKSDILEIYLGKSPTISADPSLVQISDKDDCLASIRRILARQGTSGPVAYDGKVFSTVYLVFLGMFICHLTYRAAYPDTVEPVPLWLVGGISSVYGLYLLDRPSNFEPVYISLSQSTSQVGLWGLAWSLIKKLFSSAWNITLMAIAAIIAGIILPWVKP